MVTATSSSRPLTVPRPAMLRYFWKPSSPADGSFAALGQQLHVDFVLGARFTKNADGSRSLAVRLMQSEGGAIAWSADFSIGGADTSEVGTKIAEAILPLLPRKK